MGLNSTASGKLQKETWKSRTVYNQSQKYILQKQFEQNPYPDTATRKQLSKEIGIPERNIRIWYKNHRRKQRKLGSEWYLRRDQTQEQQQQQQPWTQEYLAKKASQDQTSITKSQSNIFIQAFEKNLFPGVATRKMLSKQADIQESIQNRRSPYPGQNRGKPVNSLVESPNGTPDLTAQQHQINLFTLPGRSHHFPSSNSFSNNQTSLPALLLSHVSFVPCVSQGPSVMMGQPMQAGQGGENSPTQTLTNYLPTLLTPERDLSDTHSPFWTQNEEKCQNHKEQTSTGILHLKDYSLPHPEHKKHQSQDLDQMDISYSIQWWDECCQALIAKWDPREGTP